VEKDLDAKMDNYYRHLLAKHHHHEQHRMSGGSLSGNCGPSRAHSTLITTKQHQDQFREHKRLYESMRANCLQQRERSTSAPNVRCNLLQQPTSETTQLVQRIIDTAEKDVEKHSTIGKERSKRRKSKRSKDGHSMSKYDRQRARSADDSAANEIRDVNDSMSMFESIENWVINQKDLQYRRKIGSGSYGTVYYGTYHGPVALKQLKVTNPTQIQVEVSQRSIWPNPRS